MKLLSNTKFGKYCKSKESEFENRLNYLLWYEEKRNKFDAFLEQELTLGSFIPCDESGRVLTKPERWEDYIKSPESFDGNIESGELYNYEDAVERVLFKEFSSRKEKGITWLGTEGFEIQMPLGKMTIEGLVNEGIELTNSAIEKLGL